MKTKEEKRTWILENCVDECGTVMLNDLDFTGKTVSISGMVARVIFQDYLKAGHINQRGQKADIIDNSKQEGKHISNIHQKAEFIDNRYQVGVEINNKTQTILPQRKVVEFEINEEERIKLNSFLKEMRR